MAGSGISDRLHPCKYHASTVWPWLAAVYLTAFIPANITHPQYGPPRQTPGRAMSACRKSLFDTLRHFSDLQKALKNADHHRAGHPSRVSRTHPSAPLTKGSRSFGWPRNRRISCGGFVVSKKSFRHDETSFRASKSSEKWGSSSCRTPFPGFPHTPFRPVDERLPLF